MAFSRALLSVLNVAMGAVFVLQVSCSIPDDPFAVDVSLSHRIGTVAIVEWSTTHEPTDSAYIEFGLDTEYGLVAPVELSEPEYRTVLLGMKPATEYHFRIVVNDGQNSYFSEDYSITTGPVPNGLPTIDISTIDQDALEGGYTVSVFYLNCETFISDRDGNYVWWYFPDMERCSRARMSFDGKHMLVGTVNVSMDAEQQDYVNGRIVKISMDGLEEETFDLVNSHHDLAPLPGGSIAYIAYDDDDCDDIMELDSQGNIERIFHLADAIQPPSNGFRCHSNSLIYWPEDDSYSISVLNKNQFLKISRSGDLLWILGGDENHFEGNPQWFRQHGHHMYDGSFLFFSNTEIGEPSVAVTYTLDEKSLNAELVWEYSDENQSPSFGDVQRLVGGNTLITFSNSGIIVEVDANGNLVQETQWDLGGGLGYSMRRESLYGPPPK